MKRRLGSALLLHALGAATLAAQTGGAGTRVLLVTGLSGEPRFATAFHATASALYDAAQARWGVADSSLLYLAEDSSSDRARVRSRSTRENLAKAFATLARQSARGDLVLVVLIGHGSGEGAESRLSLPGVDATAADFAGWLRPLAGRTVVFVNAASGSGDFLAALADSERVVITATKSAFERNETTFAEHFTRGLTSGEADADKDGRVTVLEAFGFAKREVARGYEAKHALQTEHAQLSDSALARSVAFGTAAAPADPALAALYAERRALEDQVAALRRRKSSLDSLAYERELERLLLALAEKTAAIKALEVRKP